MSLTAAEPAFIPPAWVHDLDGQAFLERIAEIAGEDDQLYSDLLWLRCERDVGMFCSIYFPGLCYLPFNDAHWWLLDNPGAVPGFEERVEQGMTETAISVEAPRGLAKTTIAKLIVVHRIVYGLERYVLWGGVAFDEAVKETRHLRSIFATPEEEFAAAYGPFTVEGREKDWRVSVAGQPAVMVSARGFPKGKVRGSNDQGQRPTMIVGDDVEHPEAVRNPNNRRELSVFIDSDVRNAGPKEGGLFWLQIGTRLHTDSQTARNANNPAYRSRKFRSMIRWPDRGDLWEECKRRWADLTDPERVDTARAFYRANRQEMSRGAEVLDPHAQGLFTLHQILWSRGPVAFSKDYQNEAIDPTLQVFPPPASMPRCVFDGHTIHTADGRDVPLTQCRLSLWLDPRASEEMRKNDYAALPVVAEEQMKHGAGYRFVLGCLLDRVGTEQQVDWLWQMFDHYGPRNAGHPVLYGYEDNGFQKMMGAYLDLTKKARGRLRKSTALSLTGHTSRGNKQDRIMGLAPQVSLRWLQFATTCPPLLLEQFHAVPTGAHDDGPDAVERALWHLTSQTDTRVQRGNPFQQSRRRR